MTCFGSQGLTDSKVADADRFFPPIRFLPVIGRRFSTAVSASREGLAVGLDREIGQGLVLKFRKHG